MFTIVKFSNSTIAKTAGNNSELTGKWDEKKFSSSGKKQDQTGRRISPLKQTAETRFTQTKR